MDPANLSALYHQRAKRRSLSIPLDQDKWPEDWKTVSYKEYPRLKKLTLPVPTISSDFFSLLRKRRSHRDFAGIPLSIEKVSTLLRFGAGLTAGPDAKRSYPSAGALYPLEIYLGVFSGDAISPGFYHYGVQRHELTVLLPFENGREMAESLFTFPWAGKAAGAIFITAIFSRVMPKYKERAYRNTLLEAGHLGQNLLLTAEALNMKSCAMAGTADERIEQLLGLDGVSETLVHALLLE